MFIDEDAIDFPLIMTQFAHLSTSDHCLIMNVATLFILDPVLCMDNQAHEGSL